MHGLLELLVDGERCEADWPLDRGLQYGDGLFETMLVRNGQVRFQALHRARLAEGCRRLAIAADQAAVWQQVCAVAGGHDQALLRLQVTRGSALARGYTPSGREQARLILAVFSAADVASPPAPRRVQSLRMRLGENPALAGLKHCNRLEQVLARQELLGSNALEGLLASSSGLLVSGTMSNVFLELDGELVTPALERCGVAGVARAAVLREARRAGVAVRIAELPFEVLERAGAMALSNARMGLLAVDELDGRRLARDPRLLDLAATVARLDD